MGIGKAFAEIGGKQDLLVAVDPGAAWRKLSAADYALSIVVSVVCVLVLQVWQVRIGLDLSDEGLLWYNTQRTLAGELALRDFQPYDPGRFYLFAGWARLCHNDGIVALRYGGAVVQFVALVPALLLLGRVLPSRWLLPPFGLIAAAWMVPRFKLVDVAASVFATWMLARLAAEPTHRRHLLAGMTVGLLWWIGRNHALYAGLATVMLVIVLAVDARIGWPVLAARVGWCGLGVVLGSLPMTTMLLAIPGYAAAYWENAIARYARLHTTNMTRPVPWPWTKEGISVPGLGLGVLLVPVAIVIAVILLSRVRRRRKSLREHSVFLAATACAATWAHHLFSRAGLSTLGETGFPLVLLLAALPQAVALARRPLARALAWGALALVTVTTMPRMIPRMAAQRHRAQYVWANIADERLYVTKTTLEICNLGGDVKRQMRPGETAAFVPYVPGLYAVLHLWCPLLDAYLAFPESTRRQEETIARMERYHTEWALIWPDRVDDRPDLGFVQTYPLVYQYIQAHFDLIRRVAAAGDVCVMHRRGGPP